LAAQLSPLLPGHLAEAKKQLSAAFTGSLIIRQNHVRFQTYFAI